jgi:hypothetical protein
VHHITLPILDERGTRVESHEVLEVEHESDGTVRLTHSPAFVAGIARGDLIALDAAAWSGFRILERGGMLAAVVSFSAVEQRQEAEPSLSDEVRSLGGMCEGGPGGALVFSIPVSVGFSSAEAFLNSACRRFPGAGWYFGNVWGPGGQPLNWGLELG